jgi:hypothetical protein
MNGGRSVLRHHWRVLGLCRSPPFCAHVRVTKAGAHVHHYCGADPPDTGMFNILLLEFMDAGHAQMLDLFSSSTMKS